jgi:hypothetical protein
MSEAARKDFHTKAEEKLVCCACPSLQPLLTLPDP